MDFLYPFLRSIKFHDKISTISLSLILSRGLIMWCLPDDDSKAVITAVEHIHSAHRECHLRLPETAIVFFMSKGTDYLVEHPFTITNPLRIPFQIKFLVLRIISD